MTRIEKLKAAMAAAVEAGNVLSENSEDALKVSTKGSLREVVTEIDTLAEKKVIEMLRRHDSECTILAEETGILQGSRDDDYWVIDALDGTVNYLNRIPYYSVSIALFEQLTPTVGVVFQPASHDLYYGADGIGVYKNQTRIVVKDRPASECLFAATFSGTNYQPMSRTDEFNIFQNINDTTRGCLRTGSTSLNLAFLAEGRLGGCWGLGNKIWDTAGGLLLAELAGATVKYDYVNREENLIHYVAAVPSAWEFINKKLQNTVHDSVGRTYFSESAL